VADGDGVELQLAEHLAHEHVLITRRDQHPTR
jgi:hypothetical protein